LEGQEVIAFKWFAAGAVAPFTGVRWPRAGWVSAPAGGSAGSGVHACRIAHLPWWLDAELWRVELGGAVIEYETQLEAPRGRLLDRLTSWNAEAFARACAGRAAALSTKLGTKELAQYAELAGNCRPATAAYVAAVAAVAAQGPEAFAQERAWQAQWLATALNLHED
jgi:hypothetical protein